MAFALWAIVATPIAEVRRRVCAWQLRSDTAARWPTLTRWATAARAALGDPTISRLTAAARAAQRLMGRAPPTLRRAPRAAQAFAGAVRCHEAHRVLVGIAEPTALDHRRRTAPRGTQLPGALSPPQPTETCVDPLVHRDYAEAIAMFRAEVIGALTRSELSRGKLAAAIRTLAERRLLPPGRRAAKCFAVSTLERWYSAYRRGGLAALVPQSRSDRGRAREVAAGQRQLLLDIRHEHEQQARPCR